MAGFRDRFFTPPVARAITSPSGIVAAGAGTAAGIVLLGLGPAALALGLAAYAVRVGIAIPRGRPSGDRIDPFRVGEPWRRFVSDALQAQRRFADTAKRAREGPVRERLMTVASRIDDAVRECWRIARHGDQLHAALRSLDVAGVRRDLEEVHEQRRLQRGHPEADAALFRAQQAIESQLNSASRLEAVARDAENRLRVLNAQLDEAVARSVEISLHAGDAAELGALTADVDTVVGELEALRQGLEEVASTAGESSGTAQPGTA